MALEVSLFTETLDASYATTEEYCSDYYALRVDEIEEAVVADYVEELRSGGSGTASEDGLVSINALCFPNATNETARTTVAATFSIRFEAYASSLFDREDGATLDSVKLVLNAFFEDKVASGDWASDRLAQTTDSSWTGSRRRLDDSAAAQEFISPQSVLDVDTVIVETLNPTSCPSFWPTSLPSRCPTSGKPVSKCRS